MGENLGDQDLFSFFFFFFWKEVNITGLKHHDREIHLFEGGTEKEKHRGSRVWRIRLLL